MSYARLISDSKIKALLKLDSQTGPDDIYVLWSKDNWLRVLYYPGGFFELGEEVTDLVGRALELPRVGKTLLAKPYPVFELIAENCHSCGCNGHIAIAYSGSDNKHLSRAPWKRLRAARP